MKKSLVLAMAMALGVTASAYAANPFSDVPAGHWAYDSLAKLADTGVIDGYPDGTFKGDETITRYEAAQITARAMAKGAQVDKLAAEFASELEALGVKVAALEKKSDNVKITGQVRYRYVSERAGQNTNSLRLRAWVAGQINDDWSYTGMLQNEQLFNDNKANDTLKFRRAYVNGKIGGVAVQAGRWNEAPFTGNVMDIENDGIKVSYGKNVKVTAQVLKQIVDISEKEKDDADKALAGMAQRVYVGSVEVQHGVFNSYAAYFKTHGAASKENQKIWTVGTSVPVAKNLVLAAEYAKGNDADEGKDTNGYVATLNYKAIDLAKPGSYNVHVGYYNQGKNSFIAPTNDLSAFDGEGFMGWNVGVGAAVAKNIKLTVDYYTTEQKQGTGKEDRLFTDLTFFF